jgi:hypothetical protein
MVARRFGATQTGMIAMDRKFMEEATRLAIESVEMGRAVRGRDRQGR